MDSENNDNVGSRTLRLLRPSVVVLCGPAACGKSTFAEKHFRPTQIISSDWARARVCDDERDQRFNAQAFALAHFLIEQRLMLNRLCVVDSTALTAQARKNLLELAKKYQVPTVLMCFNIPLDLCLERDGRRDRTVGRAIIERQYEAFEQSRSTLDDEGFDQVVEFRPEDVDKVRIEILFRPAVKPSPRGSRADGAGLRRMEGAPQPARPRSTVPGGNGHSSTPTKTPIAVPARPAQPAMPAAVVVASSAPPHTLDAPAAMAAAKPPAALPRPAAPQVNQGTLLGSITGARTSVRPLAQKLPVGGHSAN